MSNQTDDEWKKVQRQLRKDYNWDNIEQLQRLARELKKKPPAYNLKAGSTEWDICKYLDLTDAESCNCLYKNLNCVPLTRELLDAIAQYGVGFLDEIISLTEKMDVCAAVNGMLDEIARHSHPSIAAEVVKASIIEKPSSSSPRV